MELPEAVRAFQTSGTALVKEVAGSTAEPLWAAANNFVECLLLGVREHLPDVSADCDLIVEESGLGAESVSLVVRFAKSPIVGQVCTPTRFCFDLHLLEAVKFTLHNKPANVNSDQLVLSVKGMVLAPLVEIPRLRDQAKAELGDKFNKFTAHGYWLRHKDEHYPLQTSKLHRIYESLWGSKAAKMLPGPYKVDFMWGFLLATNMYLDDFVFNHDPKVKVTVMARMEPCRTQEEKDLLEISTRVAQENLAKNRSAGEFFANSVTNFAAMLHAHTIGQPSANAKAITKLFSAAQWWGPGEHGWHRWEDTWLCRDQKGSFGHVIATQGRMIWQVHQTGPAQRTAQKPRRFCFCCRRREPTTPSFSSMVSLSDQAGLKPKVQ